MQHQSPDLSAQDVNLLHLIIVRAQNQPDFPRRPKKVLFDAYEAVFTENGLDTHHDRACLPLLLRLGGPGLPGNTLYERFEYLLEQAGIVLDFEEDHASIAEIDRKTDLEELEYEKPRDVADLHTSPRKVERRNSFTSMYDLTTAIARQLGRRNSSRVSESRIKYDLQPLHGKSHEPGQLSRVEQPDDYSRSITSDPITHTSLNEIPNHNHDGHIFPPQSRHGLPLTGRDESEDEADTRAHDIRIMEIASQKDKITLLRQAFALWRTAFQSTQQHRRFHDYELAREAEFEQHYKRAVAAYDLYLVDKVFYHWRWMTRIGEEKTAAARKWFLRIKYFSTWYKLSATQELKAERFVRKTFFQKWVEKFREQKSQLESSETRVKRMDDWRIARKCFKIWTLRTRMIFKADSVNVLRIKQNGFSAWNEQLRFNAVRGRIDDRILAEGMYRWVLAQRANLFVRRSEQRQKSETLRCLIAGYRRRRDRLSEQEAQVSAQKNMRLTKSTLECWKLQMNVQRERERMAIEFYNPKIELDNLEIWRRRLKNVQRHELRGEDARYYFLMTNALKHWQSAAVETRKKRINEAYKRARRVVKVSLLHRALQKWRGQVNHVADLQRRSQQMNDRKGTALVQSFFVKWQISASQWQQTTHQASAHYENLLLKQSTSTILDVSRALQSLETRAEQFHFIRISEICSTQLRRISMKAFEVKRRQHDAEAMRDRHWAKHIRNILRYWAARSRDVTLIQQKPSPLSIEQETIDAGYGTGTGTAAGSTAENASNSNAISTMLNVTQRAEEWTAFDQDLLEGTATPGYLNTPSKRAARVRALANLNDGSTTPATPWTAQLGRSKFKPIPWVRRAQLFRDLG